jgi:hypothetical protein
MATARPQVNPFYIEPAAQEWSGDYDWRNDEDDVEHEGLLDSTNNNWDEDPDSSAVRRRADRRSTRHQQSPYRFRFLVGFGMVFIVFLVVLTLLGDSNSATQGTLDKADGDNDNHDNGPQQQQVQQIVILGERVSGVPWLKEQLQGMYPNIIVTTTLQREGIWFQGPPDKPIPRTLVFAVFRNPHDWVEQMRLHPRFMPAHMDRNGPALPCRPFVEME